MPLAAVLVKAFPWCSEWENELRRLFDAYVQAKHTQNVLDYDDLLLFWVEMLGEPQLTAELAGRFDHVLVDEYQDTNPIQAKIFSHSNRTAAGSLSSVTTPSRSTHSVPRR